MTEYKMFRQSNSGGGTTVTLQGVLSIESSTELCQLLTEALDESAQISINLQNLEDIDLTSLQVICSACKTASATGRSFDCEFSVIPDCISAAGKHLGAPQGLPCGQNNNKPCIWYGGIK